MKKFISLLLMALPMFALVSCHDDKDLPNVDFNFEIENAVRVDGKLYVVQGDNLEITSITVSNREAGKPAMITAANFYWDYYFIGASYESPFGFEIEITSDTPVGNHILEVECPLYAIDKEPASALVQFNVVVVASADEIPDGGSATFTIAPRTTENTEK